MNASSPSPSRSAIAVIAGCALAIVLAVSSGRAPLTRPTLVGGIQVNESDHSRWFRMLARSGMNTVATTVYAKQGDWDGSQLWWEEEEPAVVAEIRGAKRAGLEVVLVPRVALDHAFPRNRFLWHGRIAPLGGEALDAWFDRYRSFLVHWATFAERERVDVFAIGSELSELTSTAPIAELPGHVTYFLDDAAQVRRRDRLLRFEDRIDRADLAVRGRADFASLRERLDAEIRAKRDWALAIRGPESGAVERLSKRRADLDRRWREIVAELREIYSGHLTYAANFDQYQDVGFWDALDIVGINAYFELRGESTERPPDAELERALVAGWSSVLADMTRALDTLGVPSHPVLFTEIGYTFRENSTVKPWAGSGLALIGEGGDDPRLLVWRDQPRDDVERALAIDALRRALSRNAPAPDILGLLYWKLSTRPVHRRIEPFVAVLGESPEDPIVERLRAFRRAHPLIRTDPGRPARVDDRRTER